MYGGLDSQLFLGNREWYILDEGRELNKPVIMKQKKEDDQKNRTNRRPSEIQDNLIDSENVVGLMGDDEDIQQAQYNVMSMIDERLDEYNGDIKEKLNTSINNRLTEIENLMGRIKEDRDNNFEEINELRRISDLQTGIMSNMGMIIDDSHNESQLGLQQDLTRLDRLVFSQYQRDRNDLELSSPTIPLASSPGEGPHYYGKIPGKSYYHTQKIEDLKDETGNIDEKKRNYYKYTKFPYFLNIDLTKFTDPEDGSYDKFECKPLDDNDDDNFICEIQHPKSDNDEYLSCNSSDPKKPTNLQPFLSNKTMSGKCDLEWDPDTKTYICENWNPFSSDYALTDSLNPTPMIDSDYRRCIPNLMFGDYGYYGPERYFHKFLVVLFSAIVLYSKIESSNEGNDRIAFFLTIVISFVISHYIFYTNIFGLTETSLYDKINVAFKYDSPPNPDTDNTERHVYWWCSLFIIVPITSIITFLIVKLLNKF